MIGSLLSLRTDNPIPDYNPEVPSDVQNLFATGLGWVAGIGLGLLAIGAMVGTVMAGIGLLSERAEMAARGKKAVLVCLIAAALLALVSGLVWMIYNEAQG
ncbi:hypothetical protein GCM10009716_49370 [Streptomyces sodiiphilus]|uniref:DUF4190 domain-containing protein n=1 Tax=Streptomyces sodiiphilus TaxID=226217 RepID=A0ABP5B8X4_9ACTN